MFSVKSPLGCWYSNKGFDFCDLFRSAQSKELETGTKG